MNYCILHQEQDKVACAIVNIIHKHGDQWISIAIDTSNFNRAFIFAQLKDYHVLVFNQSQFFDMEFLLELKKRTKSIIVQVGNNYNGPDLGPFEHSAVTKSTKDWFVENYGLIASNEDMNLVLSIDREL